jgi:hypothetical protein
VLLKLENAIEEELWSKIYTEQLARINHPLESANAKAQLVQCTTFADDALLSFRARRGSYPPIVPIVNGTLDTVFYRHQDDS